MPPIETYSYFSEFVDINGKVLDFGSNSGNLIRSSYGKIREIDYTGIDISSVAIEEGRKLYPDATWILYNRRNPCYNPDGDNLFPTIGNFDRILSYSVFSHFPLDEILFSIEKLYHMLNNDGEIAFSYCNILNRRCVEWFRNRRQDCDLIPVTDYIYLVDNYTTLDVPYKSSHFVSFFKPEFIIDQLNKKGFAAQSFSSTNLLQDCIVIKKHV